MEHYEDVSVVVGAQISTTLQHLVLLTKVAEFLFRIVTI